ncbi:MAG: hypothetical protein K8R48_01735 [Alphaproteobacteria bacterium]|nr:hypothetical protein [Alphaproteobacteria bacterium]
MKKWLVFLVFLSCFPFHEGQAAPPLVRITGIDDLNLGTWDVSSDMTGNDPVCVYNTRAATYRVTATDNSTIEPGQFRLENTERTVQIPYTVQWAETASPGTGTVELQDGVVYGAGGANTLDETCRSGELSANLGITVAAVDMQTLPAGTYTATVTIGVTP